ncbi:hypothetical protein QW131_15875 [Roseibium salinum]|nr:hypothetical protein [Roseibium salinum]
MIKADLSAFAIINLLTDEGLDQAVQFLARRRPLARSFERIVQLRDPAGTDFDRAFVRIRRLRPAGSKTIDSENGKTDQQELDQRLAEDTAHDIHAEPFAVTDVKSTSGAASAIIPGRRTTTHSTLFRGPSYFAGLYQMGDV